MKIYNLALNQWRYSGWQIELQEESEAIWLPVLLVGLSLAQHCGKNYLDHKDGGKGYLRV